MKTLAKIAVLTIIAILHCPITQSCVVEVKNQHNAVSCAKAAQATNTLADANEEEEDVLMWKMPAKYHF